MKMCPECRFMDTDPRNNYCYKDGAKLITPAECDGCTRLLHPVDKFCPACGRSTTLEKDSAHLGSGMTTAA